MSITGHRDYKTIQEHYRKVSLRQKQKEINEKMNFDPIMKVGKWKLDI